jgi:hypothetical protein
MSTEFSLLQSRFLLYPFYCPLTHTLLFHWRKRRHLKSSLQTNNSSEPTLLWGTGHYYCRGVINLSSLNSPSPALSCLQIKLISCELQNILGNAVIKNKILLFLLIFLYYYYYYYCFNRHTAPAPPQPSVRCAPIYKNVGQHCYIVWVADSAVKLATNEITTTIRTDNLTWEPTQIVPVKVCWLGAYIWS